MKRVLVLSLVIVMSMQVFAGSLEPSAAPGPTMKTLDEIEARIPLNVTNTPGNTQYQYVISSPGSYYLIGNVETSKGGISITSDNVTVDLKGFMLKCTDTTPSYTGIYFGSFQHLRIENGSIRNFKTGVLSYWSSDARLSNLQVSNCTEDGIFLYGYTSATTTGGCHVVSNCTSESNGHYGIYVGEASIVENCAARQNGNIGIFTDGSCTVRNCTALSNGDDGIQVNASSSVIHCVTDENGDNGIYANIGCMITGNTCYKNQGYGVYASTGGIISDNTCYSNQAAYGIYASMACVIKNNATYNGNGGIYAKSGCSIIGNTARNNQNNGIYAVSNCMVDQNTSTINNLSGSSYVNLFLGAGCVAGTNCAP